MRPRTLFSLRTEYGNTQGNSEGLQGAQKTKPRWQCSSELRHWDRGSRTAFRLGFPRFVVPSCPSSTTSVGNEAVNALLGCGLPIGGISEFTPPRLCGTNVSRSVCPECGDRRFCMIQKRHEHGLMDDSRALVRRVEFAAGVAAHLFGNPQQWPQKMGEPHAYPTISVCFATESKLRIDGCALARQQLGTARSLISLSIDDETNISNAVMKPEI